MEKSLCDILFRQQSICLFGQEDYVARMRGYLTILQPAIKLSEASFRLATDVPDETSFEISSKDDVIATWSRECTVIVCFSVKKLSIAKEHLTRWGFQHLMPYDTDMDNLLKRNFFKKEFAQRHQNFSLIDESKTVFVYMAKSIVDKPLKNYPNVLSPHIIPIQVGAALTDEKITDVTDNTGDNISERNRHFSETTALYWMWKNVEADYLGLCHYRRLWKNLDCIAEKLQDDIIDVVLPVPTLCVHSVYEDYMERYIPAVYPTMLDVLREMSPEYYEASKEIYRGHVFYACNMLIAKRKVLHELCQWMFPMVFEIEKRIGDLPDPYQNRYAGFCTERLITLYFLYNKEKWRITHADKIFIE